jgi:hypothetical protein
MQKLYSAGNLQEAYLLLHRLERAGIDARVLNEHAQGGLGELPFTHVYPEIWLLEPADSVRAGAILEEFTRAANVSSAVRQCPACGEESPPSFEICWRCSSAFVP